MPDPCRDDEALTDAQLLICVVNHVDTLLFMKPIGQRAEIQQQLIWEDELNTGIVKFDMLVINSGIVSYLPSGKVSSAPNPFVIQVQMLEFALFDVFPIWLRLIKVPLGDNVLWY